MKRQPLLDRLDLALRRTENLIDHLTHAATHYALRDDEASTRHMMQRVRTEKIYEKKLRRVKAKWNRYKAVECRGWRTLRDLEYNGYVNCQWMHKWLSLRAPEIVKACPHTRQDVRMPHHTVTICHKCFYYYRTKKNN